MRQRQAGLRKFLPAAASVGNPVDMLASAPPEHYQQAMSLLLADEAVDSVLVIFIPPLVTKPDDVAQAIASGRSGHGEAGARQFHQRRGAPADLAPIPSYLFPEAAVTALSRATEYGAWRRRPKGVIPELPGMHGDAARTIVDTALTRGDGWLTPEEAQRLAGAVRHRHGVGTSGDE